MKRLLAALSIVLAALLACPCALAETVTSGGITVSFSDVFEVFTAENLSEKSNLLTEYDETFDGMASRFENDGYLFYAVSPALKCTVFLSCVTSDISRSVVDLIDYSERDTAKSLLIGSVVDRAEEVREIEKDGALFYRVVCTPESDPELDDCRIFYVTVMNSMAYTLCLIEKDSSLAANSVSAIDTIFSSLEYSIRSAELRVRERKDKFTHTLFVIMIPVALLFAAYICWSLAGDFRARRLERDRRRNVRKKPRR